MMNLEQLMSRDMSKTEWNAFAATWEAHAAYKHHEEIAKEVLGTEKSAQATVNHLCDEIYTWGLEGGMYAFREGEALGVLYGLRLAAALRFSPETYGFTPTEAQETLKRLHLDPDYRRGFVTTITAMDPSDGDLDSDKGRIDRMTDLAGEMNEKGYPEFARILIARAHEFSAGHVLVKGGCR